MLVEVVGRSARSAKAKLWFAQIDDLANVSYEDLATPGVLFEQYDYVVAVATMKAVKGQLFRRIRREEEEANRRGETMSGRQMLRMVLNSYQTDPVAKEMFNITHLNELPYLGDDRLAEFLEVWLRLLGDQEESISERQKKLLFYNTIKGSVAPKSYLDYYGRLPDNADEHSYKY